MKHRALDRVDRGLLVVLVICVLAIWPFLSRSALPQATDAELHVFRLAELGRMVSGGELYPRWAANFYYGYGYPIFNYYAPLAYYLGLLIDGLPTLDAVAGVKAIFLLGFLAAAVGMYGFVRDNWGRPAGLVAAAAYVYSPYIQFVDPHARGDLAEALSLGLFPMALWSFDRLRRRPTARRWLAAVLMVAFVILSHNLMAMVFWALLLAWVLWHTALALHRGADTLSSKLLILALVLGVGTTAFFWLVVLLERNAVNLESLIGDGGHFDFRNHFLSWQELLAWPHLLDWGATAPDFALNLGLGQVLAAAIGATGLLLGRAKKRAQGLFFTLMVAGLIFLMLAPSTFIWVRMPLLPYLQFPWRLLGAAGAMLAVLAGIGVSWLSERMQPRATGVLVGLFLVLALPMVEVPPWPADFGPLSPLRVLQIELAGRWLGTTATADFVPATVDVLPRPEPSMLEDYAAERTVDRVNRATLPQGTRVEVENVTPLHFLYNVTGDQEFLLRLFLFDFPGWRVEIDGEVIETQLGRPEGFLVIPVPAGAHKVEVRFEGTEARRLAAWVSAASFLAVFVAAVWLSGRAKLVVRTAEHQAPDHGSTLRTTVVVAMIVIVVHLTVLSPQGWLRLSSTDYRAIPATYDAYIDFGEQIALIGYDLQASELEPGDELRLNLYWQAIESLTINYQVFVHLTDVEGNLVAQSDKLNPGEFPTKIWPVDKYVRDEHRLVLPEELEAGEYRLSLGLWVSAEGWRLPMVDDRGQELGDHFVLPQTLKVR